jgi:hypothetical protein
MESFNRLNATNNEVAFSFSFSSCSLLKRRYQQMSCCYCLHNKKAAIAHAKMKRKSNKATSFKQLANSPQQCKTIFKRLCSLMQLCSLIIDKALQPGGLCSLMKLRSLMFGKPFQLGKL